jgi:hypothetical protein
MLTFHWHVGEMRNIPIIIILYPSLKAQNYKALYSVRFRFLETLNVEMIIMSCIVQIKNNTVILAIWEVEIGRLRFEGKLGKK